jgi:hypothetical protein
MGALGGVRELMVELRPVLASCVARSLKEIPRGRNNDRRV